MTTTIRARMGATEWGILALLSLLWGGSFFFLALALRGFPSFTTVFLRVGLAAVLLYAFMQLRGHAMPRGERVWRSFFVVAFFANALPFTMFAFAQHHISSGLASILNATTPLWGVLVAHLYTTDERATGGKVAGVLLGFAGVATMVGGAALGGSGAAILGQLACLVATFAYAIAGVYSRRFAAMGLSPLAVATGQLTAAAVMILPLMLAVDRPWTLPMPPAAAIMGMAGLVTLSTTVAYVLFFRLIATAGASNTLLVTFLIPVTAILLGVVVLGEAIEPREIGGMALIALGLAAIDGRPVAIFWRGRNLAPEDRVP